MQHNEFKKKIFPFQIKVKELVLNRTSKVVIKSNDNKTLSHTFEGIPLGAKYEISVQTNTVNSVPANITVNALPLPAPAHLKIYPEKNGTFVVFWRELKEDMKKITNVR